MRTALLLALLSLPALASDAIMGADPEALKDAIWQGGEAELVRDGFGDPFIRGKTADGRTYDVTFYGCEGGANCTSITFTAVFERPEDLDAEDWHDVEDLGHWNRARRFGKAWINDEGAVILEMSAALEGPVAPEMLTAVLGWWRLALVDFAESYID